MEIYKLDLDKNPKIILQFNLLTIYIMTQGQWVGDRFWWTLDDIIPDEQTLGSMGQVNLFKTLKCMNI
jgi:hypothetical protein